MLNKFIDLERLTTFFQGLKDIFLQKSEASTTYATKTEVSTKVDKVEGKGLSTLDYNTSEKSKVDNSINQISVTQNTDNVELNLSKVSGNVTAYIDEATSTKAGALSNTDKAKLDEIPTNPKYTDTIYTHPTNHSADMITESTTKRFVSDSEKTGWNNKVDKETGKGLSTNDYNNTEKANNASSINKIAVSADATSVNITGTKNNNTSSIAAIPLSTTTKAGLLAPSEKSKIIAIPSDPKYTDTIYTHPANHSADIITESASRRFVSDTEKADWNNKQDKLTAGTNVTITGTTISSTDTVYDDTALKTRITAVENREDKDTTYNVATTTTNGLMSSADKTKLNGIETGAEKNNVTSSDISNWNNKVDKVSGKQLSTNDYTTTEKNKLSGIQAGAQVNTVTSVNGQTGAVTTPDTTYNAATTTTNGLMSSADKTKLDGIEAGAQKNVEVYTKAEVDGLLATLRAELESDILEQILSYS